PVWTRTSSWRLRSSRVSMAAFTNWGRAPTTVTNFKTALASFGLERTRPVEAGKGVHARPDGAEAAPLLEIELADARLHSRCGEVEVGDGDHELGVGRRLEALIFVDDVLAELLAGLGLAELDRDLTHDAAKPDEALGQLSDADLLAHAEDEDLA